MTNQYGMSLVTDAAQWDALFSRVDHPHMVQSWAYGEARQAAGRRWEARRRRFIDAGGWRTRRLVIECEGEPVAICQLLDKSLAGLRWASRLNRGPLFLDAAPGDDVVRDVYRALRNRWKHGRGVLVLAPELMAGPENSRMMTEIGFRDRHIRGGRSARIDLRLDEEQLRKNLAPTWRNRLRAAERAGLALTVSQSPEDLEWLIDRHVENMAEKGFLGPAPTLLKALYRAAPDDVFIFQARLAEEVVGGMMIYRFGHTAEYYVGWFGREGRKANVGNFMYWQIVLDLQRRGCRFFDVGGYRDDASYGHFKQGMRGVEYVLLNECLAF